MMKHFFYLQTTFPVDIATLNNRLCACDPAIGKLMMVTQPKAIEREFLPFVTVTVEGDAAQAERTRGLLQRHISNMSPSFVMTEDRERYTRWIAYYTACKRIKFNALPQEHVLSISGRPTQYAEISRDATLKRAQQPTV